MNFRDFLSFTVLSAIWGSSFIFMKVSSPELGPVLTTNIRVGLAAVFLLILYYFKGNDLNIKKYWKQYLTIGLLNAALPFAFICTAELHISVSLASILNATTPLFAAIFSYFLNKENLGVHKLAGLVLGFFGVIILVGGGGTENHDMGIFWIFSILATLCYGFGCVYTAKTFKEQNPFSMAFIQQLAATMIMLPVTVFTLPERIPSTKAILSVIALALLCTVVAYLLFYNLLARIGPVKTSMTTFLIPVFGILWANIFQGEEITLTNIIGLGVIVSGIFLTTCSQFLVQIMKKQPSTSEIS